jgi:uncharacterized protein YcbK (DUF882 family)
MCSLIAVILVGMMAIANPSEAAVRYKDRGKAGLSGRLVVMLNSVEQHFGRKAIVVSGCRSRAHNRRIGGARESYHLRCMAADIIVPGVSKYRLWGHLMHIPGRGGVGTYCRSSFVHLDVGPRREWAWGCGRKYKRRLARRK